MNAHPRLPLLSEVGIIALVADRWGPCWQARHQIATRLARYFQIVWVDCPPTWQESLRWFVRRHQLCRSDELPDSFQLLQASPWSPNLGRPTCLRHWLSRRRLQKAQRTLQNRGCSKIVLYLWRPEFANSVSLIEHQLSCYHIDDEYSFSPFEQEPDAKELELIRQVDQVFVHSPAMMEKKGSLNPHTTFIPNGVDYRSYTTPKPEPADLHKIPRPRIGYTGSLKRMLDWQLLLELSAMHPQWSFVFVGPMLPHLEVEELREQLSKRQNIYILAAQPTELIPSYVQHFDVCIMPYKLDGYTRYIYPLKMHEYLATGKPVVGSPIPALESFGEVILLANGAHEWSNMLAQALSSPENSSERGSERQKVAAGYDWDILVEKIAATLARRLGLALLAGEGESENGQQSRAFSSRTERGRQNRVADVALSKS